MRAAEKTEMRPASLVSQVSSGGVIYRDCPGGVEVALVAVKGGKIWCLPKGIVDKGENLEETALREVKEETGLKGRVVEKIGQSTYWYYMKEENAKCKKTVHFYLLRYETGSTGDHDGEVDRSCWFPIEEAIEKLNYRGDKEIMLKAKGLLREMNEKVSRRSRDG